MKKHQLLVALVVVGAFVATGKAELVGTGLRGTKIVEDVRVRQRPTGTAGWMYEPAEDAGWVVWTVEVKLKPYDPNKKRHNWDQLRGGFASDADFWNPDHDKESSTFEALTLGDSPISYGSEFLINTNVDTFLEVESKDLSSGSEVELQGKTLGGGQLSVNVAFWGDEIPEDPPPGYKPPPAPVPQEGWFELAQLVVPSEGATIYPISKRGDSQPMSIGPIQFMNGTEVAGTIVPEPSSLALVVVGVGFLGTLAFRRRKRT